MNVEKSFNLWFTGLPSSGKTTTAKALHDVLLKEGIVTVHLDGDVVRDGLNQDLGFSEEDRKENNRRIIHVGEIIVSAGVPVLTTFISPYRETRAMAREVIPNFIEVYVATTLEECEKRDVKGLYAKARAGEIKGMTGIDDPYEAPENPEITLETQDVELQENVDKLLAYLKENGYLSE